jgi:DNA polymerase-3 subunit epsilon
MLIGKPNFESIKDAFLTFIGDEPLVFHNAPFDLKFLRKYKLKIDNRYFDTLRIAKKKLPGLANYKLDTIIRALCISAANRHRALGDATCTGYVFINISKS